MNYKVIRDFYDLEDNNRYYEENGLYPREGLSPSKERIDLLLSNKNNQARPVLEEINTKVEADKNTVKKKETKDTKKKSNKK